MFNHDAGHTHGPTPHFVSDCPLCTAAKNTRNQAIAHLAEALHLLSDLDRHAGTPTIRLNLSPIGLTGDDTANCHSIDLTAKRAESIADAIDSMTAYLSSGQPDEAPIDRLLTETADAVTDAVSVDYERLARFKFRFMGWLEGQGCEAIESGEFSAAAVAQCNPDLYADVTDLFNGLDLIEITRDVLDEPVVSKLSVTLALDSLLGETGDTFEDEDGQP